MITVGVCVNTLVKCRCSHKHAGTRAETGKSKGFGCTWDSLRNSAGEKILQLRSHPLGIRSDSNFCSLLSDLSVEQSFDVSYLDLGELTAGPLPTDQLLPAKLRRKPALVIQKVGECKVERSGLEMYCSSPRKIGNWEKHHHYCVIFLSHGETDEILRLGRSVLI